MKFFKEIMSWTFQIFLAVIIALFISVFVVQPTHVVGKSMEPTLQNNDKVLINKLTHTLKNLPDYEDIVIIDSRVERPRTLKDDITEILESNMVTFLLFNKSPKEIYWVKRVIGRPGDVLEFSDGKVIRNGKVLDENYIKEPMQYYNNERVIVPPNYIFVMGDNRNYSNDSRYIGCVPLDHIIGKYIIKF